MELLTEGDYADHLNKAEKEDKAADAMSEAVSSCCGAPIWGEDICSQCKEHTEPSDEPAIEVDGFRCYDCGELFFGKPIRVITDYHGETTPFCEDCWEEYKATIFANKFGF